MTGYFSEIWRLRHFWMALVRVDLRNRYRRTIIGMGWSLLHPIAMTAVFCVFFATAWGVNIKTYAPHVLTGLTFWGFMSASVMQGCRSFLQGESYIRQHPAPLAIYPLRTTLSASFHFLIGFVVAIGLVGIMQRGFHHAPMMLCLVPAFMLLFIIGWSLSIIMGAANVLFRDTQHLAEVAMQMLFYMTPIMYLPKMLPGKWAGIIIPWNPLASLLELLRAPLIDGCLPSNWAMGMSMATAMVAVLAAALTLRFFEKRLIFYL